MMGNILPFNPVPQSQGLNARETCICFWTSHKNFGEPPGIFRVDEKCQDVISFTQTKERCPSRLWDGSAFALQSADSEIMV